MNKNYNSKRTSKIPMWKSMFTVIVMLITATISNAQVTTNSGSGLAPTYPDLASAITALNGTTITSPVTITLVGNETAPVGGYAITAQGTAANTILIQGNTSTITASGALVAGTLTDAIFKLVGADYVTLQNFTMQENATNLTTAAATNNMTEWGVALLYATTTNGAQNNTIQNNTISLNRVYQNTFGIYSNSTHTAILVTTSATATSATGGNHSLKIYANAISNVNNGIVVVGPTAVADQNTGLDIGGTSLVTANTITNYGTTGTFSAYANVSGSVNGILVRNSNGTNISYNTVTSSVGGVTAGTLNGIQLAGSSNAPTSAFTNTINNNNISLKSGLIAGAINGINYPSGSSSATSTLNINNNDFNNFGHTVAGTGAIVFITTNGLDFVKNINNNTFTNISVNTTGSVTFISHGASMIINATHTISNNAIVTAFSKTGAGGTITGLTSGTSSVNGSNSVMTNNNLSNITVTGATAIVGITNSDGAGTSPNRTVTGNIFNNWAGGTSSITGMSFTYIGATSNISNNIITNVSGQGAITGITIGSSFSGGNPLNITNNTVANLVSSGAGGTIIAIACSSASPLVNISGNAVNTLSSTGASSVTGLTVSGASATGTNAYKNKIYDLSGSNAASTVNGLLISGGTLVTAYNNIIGDLRTPIANAGNPLNGINITGGTTVNAYNNTVMLNASSTGALFGSSAVSVSTTPTVTLRNNIFVNNSTTTGAGLAVAYRRSSTTLTSYATASNNNLFYASNIFTDGTNTDVTLTAYKTRVASRDASSVSENPNFVSTFGANANFLHIDTTIATQIESGGANVAVVTDDFDGDVRNATTPDIGADEFAGILLDIVGPTITHTVVSNDCTGGVRTISATIADASGVPTSGAGLPVAYWRINAGPYSAVTAVSAGAGVYNFSVGTGSVLGDVITYYFVAQDNVGTPNLNALPSSGAAGFTANPPAVTTAPTTPFSYSVVTPLNGVYTVGVAGAYTTLTAAVADYNTKCLTGPVTFSLIDATYPAETYPITISQNTDASTVNTLTIKSAVGVSPTISGSNTVSIIKLDGADYVTIDGSNGVSSRDLTIENTSTGTIIWVASTLTNGALNTVIKNTNVMGNTLASAQGIIVSGSVLGAAAEVSNSNLTITNNTFKKVQNGVFAFGNATTPDQNWIITNNIVGSAVVAEKLSFRGLSVQNAQNFTVSGNQISGVITASTSTTAGILIGANSLNGNIFNNKIYDIKNTNTTGYGSVGLYLNSSSTVANINTYNNFISDVSSYGYASTATIADNGNGMFVGAGAGYGIYNNSVAMNTNQTVSGLPAAINIGVGVTLAGAVNIRNNIFSNTQTQTGEKYTIYSAAPNTVFAAIDYNDYYSSGANLGYIGSARAALANIIAGFGGNTASINIIPTFTSSTDLHVYDAALDNLGTPIATVTNDIDGDLRSATTPDMGADEFTFLSVNQFDIVSGFKAYPNPVSNILNIEYTGELSNVTVYNLLGQQVLTKKVTATSTQIDMSGLNAGTYLVKVEANDISKTIKVVKR
ncbi:MAG: T9SS type A sorting domain-containing protein [Flavobacterium sp.]|uniref:beta strand repeat-containing protein n=1 Tax=Flavobacterium sp. TaxID=239 RepID=UPI0032668531